HFSPLELTDEFSVLLLLLGLHDLPKRTGKIPDAEKFDASFFNISDHQANFMDPQVRLFHETTFESIVDAGYDPRELKGSRTAVYIGWCYSDTDSAMKEDETKVADYLQLASNRVSMTFGFKAFPSESTRHVRHPSLHFTRLSLLSVQE